MADLFEQYYIPPVVSDTSAFSNTADSSTAVAQTDLSSANYSASDNNSSGWLLQQNGNAVLNNVVIKGALTAIAGGVIGGFSIGATFIKDTGDSFGLNTSGDWRIWAGSTLANIVNAPFRIKYDGTGFIGGWNIGTTTLSSLNGDLILDGTNDEIKSSDYNEGTSGFLVSKNLIEAQNLIARGIMRGTTFAYNIINAIGGQMMVASADCLAEDIIN